MNRFANCVLIRNSITYGQVMKMQNIRSFTTTLPVSQDQQGIKGQIAQKTPGRIMCEGGKTYSWCCCGLSGKQPLCDGSHKKSALGLKPVRFTAPETKEYFFCNCKQTNNRPFCDGTHKKL